MGDARVIKISFMLTQLRPNVGLTVIAVPGIVLVILCTIPTNTLGIVTYVRTWYPRTYDEMTAFSVQLNLRKRRADFRFLWDKPTDE